MKLDETGIDIPATLKADLLGNPLSDFLYAVVVTHLYFAVLDDLSRGLALLAKVYIDLVVLFVEVSTQFFLYLGIILSYYEDGTVTHSFDCGIIVGIYLVNEV